MLKTLVVSKIKNIPLESTFLLEPGNSIFVPIFFQSPNTSLSPKEEEKEATIKIQKRKSRRKKSWKKKLKIFLQIIESISFLEPRINSIFPFSSIPKHSKHISFSKRRRRRRNQQLKSKKKKKSKRKKIKNIPPNHNQHLF